MRRHFPIVLCLLLAAFSSGGQDYAVKPQWWDSVKVTVVKGKDPVDSYKQSVEKNKAADNLRADIRILTEILKGIPADSLKAYSYTLFPKIIADYKSLDDYANSLYWTEYQLGPKPDPFLLKRTFEDSFKSLSDSSKAFPALKEFYMKFFKSDKYDNQAKAYAVSFLLDLMLKKNEPAEVLKFLADNSSSLKELLGNDRFMFEIRAQIQKGDYESASMAVKYAEDLPELKARKDFISLRKAVEGAKTGSVKVEIDWEYDTIVEKANKCENENSSAKLINLVRSTLLAKANSFSETGDSSLLKGAAIKYKETFGKYEKAYAPSISVYINLLREKSEYSETQLMKRKNLVSLGDTQQKIELRNTPRYSSSDISIPDCSKFVFQPLCTINPGTLEYQEQGSQYSMNSSPAPLISFTSSQSLLIAQNSRQAVAFKDGAFAWNSLSDNSTPEISASKKTGVRPELLAGTINTRTDGKTAFPRMLVDGRFCIRAIDCENGRTRWTFSNEDYTACSDAVLYGDQVLAIAKKPDVISRYFLIFLNRTTGALEDEMFLFSADETLGVFSDTVLADFLMPEPAIDDKGRAFISTNFGIIFCIDLSGNYMVWARKYSRMPFALSKDLTKVIQKRRFPAPVAGKQNVLFAPLDSSAVLLMSKDTGRILQEKNIAWQDIRAAGPDSALVIEDDGKASLFSLDRLTQTASMTGQNYSYVDSLKDGFILAESSGAEIWSDTGKLLKKIPLPQNFMMKGFTRNACIGFQKDSATTSFGILVPSQQAKKTVPFQAVETNIKSMETPSIRNIDGKYYVFSANYVIKLSQKAEPEWAFPVKMDRNTMIVHLANSLILTTSSFIYELSLKDGSLIRCYPDPGAEPVDISAPAVSKGKVIFAAESRVSGKSFLMQMDESGARTLNPLPGDPTVLAIYDSGNTIVTLEERNVVQYKLADAAYSKTGKNVRLGGNPSDHIVSRLDAERLIFLHPYYCLLLDSSGLANIDSGTGTGGGKHFYQWKSYYRNYGSFVAIKFHADYWTIFDIARKSIVAKDLQFPSEPFVTGSSIISFSKAKTKGTGFTASVVDTKTEKELYREEVDLSAVFSQSANLRKDMSFAMDGKVYHVFGLSRNNWETADSEENALVTQDLQKRKFDVSQFPGYRDCYGALGLGGNVLFIFDNGMKFFSQEEFMKLSERLSPFYDCRLNSSVSCTFDGYPDEWDLQKCVPAGKNMFYSCFTKADKFGAPDPGADLYFAGVIKDEKLISKIGRDGFDSRISFAFIPGSLACFRTDNIQAAGFAANCGDRSGTKFKFNYSMSPTGDFCFFEMMIPLKNIVHFNIQNLRKIKARPYRGDIAFYFQFRDNDGTEEGIFSKTENFPLYYPRLNLVSDKDTPSK